MSTAAGFPQAEISNGQLRVQLYLPDAKNGFYRATRFDWSGVVSSLQYKGHEYYGQWFQRTDPKVKDFVYEGAEIVASPCTAMVGSAEEFGVLGFDEAQAGGTFLKIGIGMLRKPGSSAYDRFFNYDVVDGGKWTVNRRADSVEFTQVLNHAESGYGYVYRKTVRLSAGKPEMVLAHSLKNTGKRKIDTTVYNHNFLNLDHQPPGPGYVITVPFEIKGGRLANNELAEIRGKEIVYLKTLANQDRVSTPIQGFSDSPKDYDIRIESAKLGAGMRITGDRPLASEVLWSIRGTLSMEPFIKVAIDPGGEFTWNLTYTYYTLPAK